MRAIFIPLILLLLAAAPAPAEPQSAPPVEDLVARALERSPALAARRAAIASAREMEKPAAALPDPMVEAMIQNEDFPNYTLGTMAMSMAGVELRQGLPYPGKRRARAEAAQATTSLRASELAADEQRITAAVRTLYAKIYAIDRERKSLSAAHELVDLLAATAASRYSAGSGEQESILKAQLQGSRLGEQLDDLAAERTALVAELNRWLDLAGESPLGDVVELPAPGAAPDGSALASIGQDAVEASPEVMVASAAVAAAERRLAVSRLDVKPDFVPAAGFAARGSLGPVLTLRFGVELPFWKQQKQEPMIRAAEQDLEMARAELRDAEAVARAEAARLALRWRLAEHQIVRFQQAIVPQSSAALDAARVSYLAGRGDFSTVIEDFDLWLEARVQLARREADRFETWAELQRLTRREGDVQ
jgi:cobalt-zinc-cadmium efflux system outer membrane protein